MKDEVGISNKLIPLERSGESLTNRGRQNLFSGKKKGKESEEAPSEISQTKETQAGDSPEGSPSGKILDIVI
jgi:hypothetical protein